MPSFLSLSTAERSRARRRHGDPLPETSRSGNSSRTALSHHRPHHPSSLTTTTRSFLKWTKASSATSRTETQAAFDDDDDDDGMLLFSSSSSLQHEHAGWTSTYQHNTSTRSSQFTSEENSSATFSTRRQSGISEEFRSSIISRQQSLTMLSSSTEFCPNNNNKVIQSLSVNKLRLSKLGLRGREEEKQVLLECLARVQNDENGNDNNNKKKDNNNPSPPKQQTQQAVVVVLIGGVSGVGKTALALTLKDLVRRRRRQQENNTNIKGNGAAAGGVYITGKFDATKANEPYSGIVAACRELCGEILLLLHNYKDNHKDNNNHKDKGSSSQRPGCSFARIREDLINTLGPELALLTSFVPELEEIVGGNDGSSNTFMENQNGAGVLQQQQQQQQNHQDSKNRFNHAFRRFFRVATTHFAALVLVLDDLQWADVASLELLQVLISDRDSSSSSSHHRLMVIGCYRSNELVAKENGSNSNSNNDNGCSFSDTISWLREKAKGDHSNNNHADDGVVVDLTELHIGELDVNAVNEILMDLLSMDAEETYSLAEICHRRTHGNAFFLLSFVSMLQEEGLLEYNFGVMNWVWDTTDIENQTTATVNVVEMTRAQMKRRLPAAMTRFLVVASCLGSSFDASSIQHVWNNNNNGQQQQQDGEQQLQTVLARAVDEGFVERMYDDSTTRFQWVHDKIQEAATLLVPKDEFRLLQFGMGQNFVAKLSKVELEESIFMVVNLLNQGHKDELDSRERIDIARLNLQAAKRAVELSAFQSASKYCEKGVEMLPSEKEGKWRQNGKELSLDLLSTGAEVEGGLGNVDKMEAYCTEVLDQECLTLMEKMRVYNALVNSIANRNRMAEAVNLCLTILKKLKCTFPQNSTSITVSTVAGLMRTRSKVRSLTTTDIAGLPLMTDARKAEAMKILNKLALYCYMSKNPLLPLAGLRMIQWTLKYGVCEASPEAFLNTGVIVTGILLDFECGAIFSKYAALLFEKLRCRAIEARVKFVKVYLAPWTIPWRSTLRTCHEAYETGMRSGDTESAAWSMVHHIYYGYQSGLSLAMIDKDCRVYIPQMLELQRQKQTVYGKLIWQLTLNLMGRTEDALILTGEAMDEETFVGMASCPENGDLMPLLQAHQTQLYAFFGEHELGAKLALAKGDNYSKALPAGPLSMSDMFLRAISLFAMARSTNKRIYKKQAFKLRSTIASFVQKGNQNARHYQLVLDAEMEALMGRQDLAKSMYEEAIVVCAKSGFLQDAAISNERYGEFLLYCLNDKVEALYRLSEASRFYAEWGSARKVEMLRRKHKELCPLPGEITTTN